MESGRAGRHGALSLSTGGGSPQKHLRSLWHKSWPSCVLEVEAPRTLEQLKGSHDSLTPVLHVSTLGCCMHPGGAWRAD